MVEIELMTDLPYEKIDFESERIDIETNINEIVIPNNILEIINDIKGFNYGTPVFSSHFKVICGERPYNKNAVLNKGLYKNDIAFIVNPTTLTVPCSLLRVYSLFFQSTDNAIALIVGLVKNNITHEQFAKYLFEKFGIQLINCFNNYNAQKTNLVSSDFSRVDEVLCVGKVAYKELVSGGVIPNSIKSGFVIHSSGLVYNSNEYFKTWHLYQDSCIKNNNGIKFADFKIF